MATRSAAGLLALLPKNMVVPVVVLAVGWYAGAKYGAPDILVQTIDGAIAQGSDLIGTLLNSGGGEGA